MKPARFGGIVAFNIQVRHYKPVVVVSDLRRKFRSQGVYRHRTVLIFVTGLLLMMYAAINDTVTMQTSRSTHSGKRIILTYKKSDNYIQKEHAQKTTKNKNVTACESLGKEDIWTSEPGVKYIFGAVAGYKVEQLWDRVLIIGLYHFPAMEKRSVCCVMDTLQGSAISLPAMTDKFQSYYTKNQLIFRAITCPYPFHSNISDFTKVTVVLKENSCPYDNDVYVFPYFPPTSTEGSVAICAKIAFGSPNTELLVEWMEAHEYLGVHKVVLYVDNSTSAQARNVLRYYELSGFLETRPYFQAGADIGFGGNLSSVTIQTTANKLVAITHCVSSLSAYSYVGIFDLDEFIIPSRGRTIPQLMKDLWTKKPDAAGFTLKTVYHMLSWDSYPDPDGLILSQYRTQTRKMSLLDRKKNFFMPSRVKLDGSITTHNYTPKEGFTVEDSPEEDAVVRHFRECRHTRLKSADSLLCHNQELRMVDPERKPPI